MTEEKKVSGAEELRGALREMSFEHPAQGKYPFERLFSAHSGFVCLIPKLDTSLLERLKEDKKELDQLGLQLITVAGNAVESADVLVIANPGLLEQHTVTQNRFLFVEEKWGRAFFVDSPDEFLSTAADFIILEDGDSKHLSDRMKAVLEKKGISFEESRNCSNCGSCPKDHRGL